MVEVMRPYLARQAATARPGVTVFDDDFGPAFIKVCAYFPYPMKIWVNGHEWAVRQALKAGIGFSELSNGFATCADPVALQAICDRLGPGAIPGVRRTLVVGAAAAVNRARPGRGLLVGAIDAPGRGFAHPGVLRAAARPRVFLRPWSSTTSTSVAQR
jgi:hypothetical protein